MKLVKPGKSGSRNRCVSSTIGLLPLGPSARCAQLRLPSPHSTLRQPLNGSNSPASGNHKCPAHDPLSTPTGARAGLSIRGPRAGGDRFHRALQRGCRHQEARQNRPSSGLRSMHGGRIVGRFDNARTRQAHLAKLHTGSARPVQCVDAASNGHRVAQSPPQQERC